MCLFFATSKLCGSNDFNTILLWPIAYVASCSMFGLMVVEATAQPQSKQRRCIFMIKKKGATEISPSSIYIARQQHIGMEHEELQNIVHPGPTNRSLLILALAAGCCLFDQNIKQYISLLKIKINKTFVAFLNVTLDFKLNCSSLGFGLYPRRFMPKIRSLLSCTD